MDAEQCVEKIMKSLPVRTYPIDEAVAIMVNRARRYGMSYQAIARALGEEND